MGGALYFSLIPHVVSDKALVELVLFLVLEVEETLKVLQEPVTTGARAVQVPRTVQFI